MWTNRRNRIESVEFAFRLSSQSQAVEVACFGFREARWDSRRGREPELIYAIGDIHGCYDELLLLLAKIRAHAKGAPFTGIFLGDYIDRGPRSRDVVATYGPFDDCDAGYAFSRPTASTEVRPGAQW